MPKQLKDMPKRQRHFSAIDRLPDEIRQQLIDARINRTHTIIEMNEWLHDESFEGAYDNISIPMLNNWFMRRGYRAHT
jgi:hypothetical protein